MRDVTGAGYIAVCKRLLCFRRHVREVMGIGSIIPNWSKGWPHWYWLSWLLTWPVSCWIGLLLARRGAHSPAASPVGQPRSS